MFSKAAKNPTSEKFSTPQVRLKNTLFSIQQCPALDSISVYYQRPKS